MFFTILVRTEMLPFEGCVLSPSEEHRVFMKKPGGKATEFPLSADVRSGPEDGQHVLLLDHLHEGGQVEERRELGRASSKIELVGTRLVEVPRHIHINSVESSRLCFRDDKQYLVLDFSFDQTVPCIALALFSNTVGEPWTEDSHLFR